MGGMFKRAVFDELTQSMLRGWAEGARKRKRAGTGFFGRKNKKRSPSGSDVPMQRMTSQVPESSRDVEQPAALEGTITSSMVVSEAQAV